MIIGLDVGGTHIDAVIVSNKKIVTTIKMPYLKTTLKEDILLVLGKLLLNIDYKSIRQINLSTTISTNAIIENKIDKVGLIIQNGPGLSNDYLTTTNNDIFISGYTDHRGIIVKDFNLDEVNKAKQVFKSNDINTIAVATKFATRNPTTELEIKDILKDDFSVISLSHQVSGKLNFPRRIQTAYLNSAIYNTYKEFVNTLLSTLDEKGIRAPIYILKADGGVIKAKESIDLPVETILSGPAASLMGFLALLPLNEDAILLDIGGTTTDIFIVVEGIPLFEPLGITIKNHKTLVRSIYNASIGLGGDSSIKVKDSKLIIGPKRKGKAFSLGGPKPTLTDAFIYLKLLNIGSIEKSKEAMLSLANKLSLTKTEVANLIIEKFVKNLKEETNKIVASLNNKPVYTINELLHEDDIIPKSINVIGGPAKLLVPSLIKHYNLPVNYPENYAVANAVGAALSKTTGEINLHIDTTKNRLIVPELGLFETVDRNVTVKDAKKLSLNYLKTLINKKGSKDENDLEVVFESSFNVVDGFYTRGKIIKIKSQVKPGLIYTLVGDKNEKEK